MGSSEEETQREKETHSGLLYRKLGSIIRESHYPWLRTYICMKNVTCYEDKFKTFPPQSLGQYRLG